MPRRLRALAALAGLLAVAAAAPAAAQPTDDPERLAEAVGRDVVHVDERARERLGAAEAGQLRLRIARRAIGRIRILVVPRGVARRNGGIGALANAVASRVDGRGALLVVAGPAVFVSTS
jgi:ABC-type amino acid transport substrate-binding protein